LGSNPLIEQIELCDQLINFCKKQTDKANGVTEEKAEETEAEKAFQTSTGNYKKE